MTNPRRDLTVAHLWETSRAGVRSNLIPGIALWVIGIAVVVTYYRVESAEAGFLSVMELRDALGFVYSGFATAIFGGLIPFLYLWRTGRIPAPRVWATALFFVVFWGGRGIEVDLLYRFQAWVFGNDTKAGTIAAKVAVDQLIYCPLWSAPVTVICYAWKDAGFSLTTLRAHLTIRGFAFGVSSVLLSIWLVWIPGTAIIYSLPLPLQIPLFNLVLCFYVLLISVLNRPVEESATQRETAVGPAP